MRSLHVVRLNGVLVQRVAGAASDADVLHRLKEDGGNRKPIELGAEAVDHLRGADLAVVERLERDVDEAAIAGAVAAGVGVDVLDGGIGLDDLDHLQEEKFMKGKDASCGPCTPPVSAPVSCCGKKPLGILTMMAKFRAMVSARTMSMRAG